MFLGGTPDKVNPLQFTARSMARCLGVPSSSLKNESSLMNEQEGQG
jgi:hypothetical protein